MATAIALMLRLSSGNAPRRIDLSYQAIDALVAWQYGGWRVYGGGSHIFTSSTDLYDGNAAQLGFDFVDDREVADVQVVQHATLFLGDLPIASIAAPVKFAAQGFEVVIAWRMNQLDPLVRNDDAQAGARCELA
mgnify:CR=1 FL=1